MMMVARPAQTAVARRRAGLVGGALVLFLALTLVLGFQVHVHRQTGRLDPIGELHGYTRILTPGLEGVPAGDGAVIGADHGTSTVVGYIGATGQLSGAATVESEHVVVDRSGDLWYAESDGRIVHRTQSGDGWSYEPKASVDVSAVTAVDGGTALVTGSCAVADCAMIIGVRDGAVQWRLRADEVTSFPDPITVDANDGPSLMPAPRLVIAEKDGKTLAIDGSGQPLEIADTTRDGATTVVGRQVVLVQGSAGEGCTVRSVTQRRWTATVPGCADPSRFTTTASALYFYSDATSTRTRLDPLHGVDLASGTVHRMQRASGVVGFDGSVIVSAESGRVQAQSAQNGDVLWTRQLRPADRDDGWVGTGHASVSSDSVVAVSHLPSWLRRLSFFADVSGRITLLDRESGEPLATALLPEDHDLVDVMALPGHRALVLSDQDTLFLITAD